ncbi:hypothetical protein [Leifsonia sp. AG29]|uniref:hypothetical protein n=1 Tax=Leifsonia sp. AG29 TaxID=2598860 RepID=UPI00131CB1BB|nr:hypothetical protein [Leifsonia sp. AG29]
MFRKILAAIGVAAALVLSAPLAAQAVDYTQGAPCALDVTTVTAGGTARVICQPGTWGPSELVNWTVTGESGAGVRLASFGTTVTTVHFSKAANADGSDVLTVTMPTTASGSYTIRGEGTTTGHVCTVTLTVLPADHAVTAVSDPGSGLADTGSVVAEWAAWLGGGLLGAGLITVAVLAWVRRVHQP